MRLRECDWALLVAALPAWEKASFRLRRAILREAGAPSRDGSIPGAGTVDGFAEFARIVRTVGLVSLDEKADLDTLAEYIKSHLTAEELAAFTAATPRPGGAGCRDADAREMARFVSSVAQVEGFLEHKHAGGRLQRLLVPGERPPILTSSELKISQWIVKSILRRLRPVPLSELIGGARGLSVARLSRAVYACVRYLVAFPALRSDDLVPVLGAWPGITRLIHGPVRSQFARVEPDQVYEGPVLMADMTTVLAALSTEPFRLRVGTGDPPTASRL